MSFQFTHESAMDNWGNVWGIHVDAWARGKKIGFADFGIDGDVLRPRYVEVAAAHRRKGVASGIFSYAEKISKRPVIESSDLTDSGRAFQASRRAPKGLGSWRRDEFKFTGTAEIIDQVRELETDLEFDVSDDMNERRVRYNKVYCGRNVCWLANKGKMVKIQRANINFIEGNQWNMEHAASIYRYLLGNGEEPLRSPAGRIHRVTAADVKMSEKFEADGELEYQLGMTEPWTKEDIGEYEAQLIDGNHRAAAALALGEPYIWVYCAENSLGDVLKKDLE